MPIFPSTTRVGPSTRRLRPSFETPGMSACRVIPSSVSKISTNGRMVVVGAAFISDCFPSPEEAACVVISVAFAMLFLLDLTDCDLPWLGRLAPADGDLHDAVAIGRFHPLGIDVVRE